MLLLNWSAVGNKSRSFSSSYLKLANHITKIPNCRKSGLFCGKWLTIKVVTRLRKAAKRNHLELAVVTAHCRLVVIHFSVAVFQFSVGTFAIWKQWRREHRWASKNGDLVLCYLCIFRLPCYREVFLKSLWKDPALRFGQRWSESATKKKKKKKRWVSRVLESDSLLPHLSELSISGAF